MRNCSAVTVQTSINIAGPEYSVFERDAMQQIRPSTKYIKPKLAVIIHVSCILRRLPLDLFRGIDLCTYNKHRSQFQTLKIDFWTYRTPPCTLCQCPCVFWERMRLVVPCNFIPFSRRLLEIYRKRRYGSNECHGRSIPRW